MTNPREVPLPKTRDCEGHAIIRREDAEVYAVLMPDEDFWPVCDSVPTSALLAIVRDRLEEAFSDSRAVDTGRDYLDEAGACVEDAIRALEEADALAKSPAVSQALAKELADEEADR